MNILEMCDWEAASVPLEATVEQAIRTMLDRRVGAVAVIDENRSVAGIFTERDVLRLSLGEHELRKIPVRQVMTAPVEMATRATTAGEALATWSSATTGTCRSSTITGSCWGCFPSATCSRRGSTR